jgi:hypothetical protein
MNIEELETHLIMEVAKELDKLMSGVFILLYLLVIGVCSLSYILSQHTEIEDLKIQLEKANSLLNNDSQKRKRKRRNIQDDIILNDVTTL